MQRLFEMLTYARPHESKTEEAFIAKYLDNVPGMRADQEGNRILQIGDSPITMFSSHIDTVHKTDGFIQISIDTALGHVFSEGFTCLGADDTAGVWLMLEMIRYNVPGLYIFHRGEEKGGIGSIHIAEETPELLNGIRHAVAFDRKGTDSIITHQFGERCCSDTFAKALAEMLRMGFKPDPTGSFTDTANYTHLVPECTNLSVGYYAQHTFNEHQDYLFLERLRDVVMSVPWHDLPAEREPKYERYSTYNRRSSWRDLDDWPGDTSRRHIKRGYLEWDEAYSLVLKDPELAANLLTDMNISHEDVQEMKHYLRGDYIDIDTDTSEMSNNKSSGNDEDHWEDEGWDGFYAPQYGRKKQ